MSSGANEANRLLREQGINGAPVHVEGIAAALEVRVIYEPLDGNVSGLMLFENGMTKVAINRAHHRNRQRFTLAHELGHLMLHTGDQDRVFVDRRFFRNKASSRGELLEEIQANAFASSLLMPRELIEQHIDASEGITDNDVFRLAAKFEVSEQAMTLRLVKFDYIQPD